MSSQATIFSLVAAGKQWLNRASENEKAVLYFSQIGRGRFMKGWPLLRTFLTLLALLLAGLPLRSLTRPKSNPTPLKVVAPTKEKITIALTFTQPPEKFSLKFLGQEILAQTDKSAFDASKTIDVHFPAEGIDLVFEGTWPEYFKKVGASIQVTRANGSRQLQTLWGKRTIFELLTFTGKAQP
ncbi:MAG: hypothetical protein ABIT76_02335 [Chthoniobacterales bacterium]